MPLEAEEKSRHRKIRLVSLAGKLSLEKMTSEDARLAQVQSIVAGETPDLQDLSFRDRTPFNRVDFAPELDSGKYILQMRLRREIIWHSSLYSVLCSSCCNASQGWEISLVKDG